MLMTFATIFVVLLVVPLVVLLVVVVVLLLLLLLLFLVLLLLPLLFLVLSVKEAALLQDDDPDTDGDKPLLFVFEIIGNTPLSPTVLLFELLCVFDDSCRPVLLEERGPRVAPLTLRIFRFFLASGSGSGVSLLALSLLCSGSDCRRDETVVLPRGLLLDDKDKGLFFF